MPQQMVQKYLDLDRSESLVREIIPVVECRIQRFWLPSYCEG